MAELVTPLRGVVGDKTASALADALDLRTVGDLLHHYPRRYAERGRLTDLADLVVGDHVTVLAEVTAARSRPMRNRDSMLEVTVGDGSRTLALTFFGRRQLWRERELRKGRRALFAGKVTEFNRKRQLTHPTYVLLDAEEADQSSAVAEYAGALIPVYPAGAAVPSWTISRSVRLALDALDEPADPLPADLRARRGLLPLAAALRAIHQPADHDDVRRATERLKWDEALVLQVTLAQRRASAALTPATPRPAREGGLRSAFDERLPFTLTDGQQEVSTVLTSELASPHPMHRLLQGEVGSGKTVVALRAMLTVVDTGGQAALLAPTEVLAGQHLRSLRDLLGPLARAGELGAGEPATKITLLTGSLSAAARRRALAEVADGQAGLVVGTHALLEEGVAFADLGLVVVDEQHRFGVEQREALRAKGGTPPHVLVMTATPIPRTVAMTVYGDLETSSLSELPGGRLPIETRVVPAADRPQWLDRAWQRVAEEVAAGHQAFVVCPRIGEAAGSDDVEPDEGAADNGVRRPGLAVLDVLPQLTDGPLAGLRLAALHGRLPPEEKDAVMRRFAGGSLDVLVATTVVEVGVDVPNATVMVVLDADRFGISQLHQLRGRVGRGSAAGLCLLVTEAPEGTPARTRVESVAGTLDGFELARLDLEQRREGDVLGAAQSGRRSQLKLLALLRDEALIVAAREEATALVAEDRDLTAHPALRQAIAAMLDDERAEYLEKA
ncbi:MAG: ATP-dependent DNA helicase RecG [Actinomycetota bacterium]|nr:ATP-dependent DNA helicase RecG [Actinomycetota bacterium]